MSYIPDREFLDNLRVFLTLADGVSQLDLDELEQGIIDAAFIVSLVGPRRFVLNDEPFKSLIEAVQVVKL